MCVCMVALTLVAVRCVTGVGVWLHYLLFLADVSLVCVFGYTSTFLSGVVSVVCVSVTLTLITARYCITGVCVCVCVWLH
jgi:hypothetical protein